MIANSTVAHTLASLKLRENESKIHEHVRKGLPAKTIEARTGRATRVDIPARIAEKVQDLAVARTPFQEEGVYQVGDLLYLAC